MLALAVDGVEEFESAYERIDDTGYSSHWGLCEAASLGALWKWQAAWFERKYPPAVPFAVLMDGRGRGLALYRGEIDVDAVLKDVEELVGIDSRERWHLAPPLKGTWFTNPPDLSYVQRVVFSATQAKE